MPERYITTVMETIDSKIAAGLTDTDVIDLWLHRQPSPLTRSAYERDIRRLLVWTGRKLSETTTLDLELFAVALGNSGLAPISQGRTLAAIRSLFRFAQRIGYCGNVAAALDLPRASGLPFQRIIPQEEIQRMIAMEPNQRNQALLLFLYVSGLRVSEACALRWRDFQTLGGRKVHLVVKGKGQRPRAVFIPQKIWQRLTESRAGADPETAVFPSRTGNALDRSRVLRIVKQAAARAGLSPAVTTHWLRHAHASHALDHGAPIHLVKATLGHASIATTSRYLHAGSGSSASFISV